MYTLQREALRALFKKEQPCPVQTRPLLVWVGRASLVSAPDACYAVARLLNAEQQNGGASGGELRTPVHRGGTGPPSWRQGMVFPLATSEKGGAVKAGQQLRVELFIQHAIKADESLGTVLLDLHQLLAAPPGLFRPRILLDEEAAPPDVALVGDQALTATGLAAVAGAGGSGDGGGGARAHWLPDSAATKCGGCAAAFTLRHRRHHCRSCGGVFCATCTSYRSRSGAGRVCAR